MFKKLVIFIPMLAFAADPSGFVIWKSGELKGMEKKLAPKMDSNKVATQQLAKYDTHLAMVAHREASGLAELHVKVADVFVVESGEGTLVIGGSMPGSKTTEPGEMRGPSIEGGAKHPISAGDIVHIPANIPHQLLVDSGKQITYFVVKVDSK